MSLKSNTISVVCLKLRKTKGYFGLWRKEEEKEKKNLWRSRLNVIMLQKLDAVFREAERVEDTKT